MKLPQAKIRELVFLILYGEGFNPSEDNLTLIKEQVKVSRAACEQADARAREVKKHIPQLDELITRAAKEYAFERIPAIERGILRLAVYELCIDGEIPEKVAISEAVRLTRKFCTAEAANFVNGVLDHIYKEVLLCV